MYENIGIHSLSPAQISKMLRGEGVRIRKGTEHSLALSKEQSKKLNKAHLKDAGYTIHLDPYQQDMHKSMRGEGVVKKVAKIALGLGAAALGHQLASQIGNQQQIRQQKQDISQGRGYKGITDANPFSHDLQGLGLPRHRGRPRKIYSTTKGEGVLKDLKNIGKKIAGNKTIKSIAQNKTVKSIAKVAENAGKELYSDMISGGPAVASHLIHTGIPIFAGAAGGVAGGLMTENPLGAALGGAAGQYAGTAVADYIGHKTGYGMKKIVRRKPKKGGALLPAGY
jgi:hypothetical protein